MKNRIFFGFIILANFIVSSGHAVSLMAAPLDATRLRLFQHYDSFLEQGVPEPALRKATEFFTSYYGRSLSLPAASSQQKHSVTLSNADQIVIIDFSQNSSRRRFYILDLRSGQVVKHLVAHGVGSGGAESYRFSNILESRQSSLGAFITGFQYEGKFGVSRKLYGVNPSNNRAFERFIVLHGAHYVSREFILKHGYLGRSHGCPALEKSVALKVIPALKEGTLIYAYHKTLTDVAQTQPDYQSILDVNPPDDNPEPTKEELEQNDNNPFANVVLTIKKKVESFVQDSAPY